MKKKLKMLKYTVLLFNLIGLFMYHLLFQASVTVTQNLPATAPAAGSFEVDVTINKSDVSGFAKFEEDFPKGFTVTALKREGATILSSDNDIRFIWASLPSASVITISFRVTADSTVSGAQAFSGKFLYVVNNERQEADATPATITITPLPANPVAAAQPPPAAAPADTAAKAAAPVTAAPAITVPAVQAISSPLFVTQSLSASTVAPATDITVTLMVHRGSVTGFAKLEEPLPNGVVAEGNDMMGGSFTFADGKAKFVWLNLPSDSVFSVSYKITPTSTASGEQSLAGQFSYLQNDNAMTFN
ncbi:MAG: hypothetical protein HKL88_05595, partial [Bacteroidia bacterium]|nr:hypothetical protein [Bacteroidia bacterium]